MSQFTPRIALSPVGTFISVPEAFKGADEHLVHVVKLEFSTIHSKGSKTPLNLATRVSPDRILFDFGAILPSAIAYDKLARDLELVREAALNHPKKLKQVVEAVMTQPDPSQPGESSQKIAEAVETLEELGLTEEASTEKGGGLIALFIIAALFLATCRAHCGPYEIPDQP